MTFRLESIYTFYFNLLLGYEKKIKTRSTSMTRPARNGSPQTKGERTSDFPAHSPRRRLSRPTIGPTVATKTNHGSDWPG